MPHGAVHIIKSHVTTTNATNDQDISTYIYTYPRRLVGGIIYPLGLQPEEDIYVYSTEGPTAIRKFGPPGEVDMNDIHSGL